MLNVGKSPIDYLTEYRVNEACKLLRGGTLSIAEVAASVGFLDQFYFSRVFKRAKGVPPSKYMTSQADADVQPAPDEHIRRNSSMPLQKNQLLTLRIERLSNDGSGVAHSSEGEAVFVPGTAPGDEAQVRIVKDCGRYAFGILDKLLDPLAGPHPGGLRGSRPLRRLQPAASGLCCRTACQAGERRRRLPPHRRAGCACAGRPPLP